MKVVKFNYTDAKGKETSRVVYPLTSPAQHYFGIDLSEFSEEEREYYVAELNEAWDSFMYQVKELGLDKNYRKFLEDRVSEKEEV